MVLGTSGAVIQITEEKLHEAAKEAARIIFHGMHPYGVGRRDEPPECRGFKDEMARIIVREIIDANKS